MSVRAEVLVFAGVTLFCAAGARAGDTLVVATGGSYQPGLAKSWTQAGDAVTFVLADGVDGKLVTAALSERLAQAKVALDGGKLVVSGIPMPALLDQLSRLSVAAESDPLVALAGLGGAVPGGEGPEAGGSIRASQPVALAALAASPDPDPAERFEADVVEVARGAFPQVALKLRVRRGVTAGSLRAKVAAGKVLEAAVLLSGSGGAVDYAHARTQRNLAAYYLRKGDRIIVHAVDSGGQLAVDWIERK